MKRQKRGRVTAIVAAAGEGTRMRMDVNKQYADIGGEPVLARTLRVFEDSGQVDSIIVAVNEQDIIYCRENIIDAFGISKAGILVSGGPTRQQSVYKGLLAIDRECETAVIHDGARPFLTEEILERGIAAAREYGAACAAVPVKDTIKLAGPGDLVVETLDRSLLWAIQTPQVFKLDLILEAHKRAVEDSFEGTDDAVLVERLGHKLKLVMGGYDNIKITTREDLLIAEGILAGRYAG